VTTATAPAGRTIAGTGTIVKWSPKEGWGLIESEGRKYFAHAADFMGECACGQLHKCQIAVGMRADFMVVLGVKYAGRFAPAFQIRVKPWVSQ
jgi:hypothetical protein